MAKQVTLPKEYTVPDNWAWVEMGVLVHLLCGYPFDSSQFSNDCEGRMPLIRIRDVVRGETTTFTSENCPEEYVIHAGDILIGMDGDFNVAKWRSEDGLLNQRVCQIRSKSEILLNDYLFYYLPDPLKKINDATPSVTVKHLSAKTLAKTPIPIPPLAEQQRIIDRIQSLFAKLDEAKDKTEAVIDRYEDRKAAILHKAFTGELTKKWRNKHKIKIEEWQHKAINSICKSLKYGTAKKSEKEGAVAVIRMGNLQQGEIDWRDLVYTSDLEDIEKYYLKPGDVLFNRTNSAALVGKTSIYRGEYPAIYAGYLIKLDYDHDVVMGEFLNYALNTHNAKEYCNSVKTDGVNQSNINAKKIGAYEIPIPSLEEQKVIVRILNETIKKEQQVKEAAEQIADQIEIIKKSILANAFRGELGTNDPSDESAEELLKQILQES